MTDLELLSEWVADVAKNVRRDIEKLSAEELAWQPDPGANNIGVTVWHIARFFDLLATRAISDAPADAELWHTRGWAKKTNHDPRGIAFLGLGAVTGYSLEEVKAIPVLSASEHLEYLDQAASALRALLATLTSADLDKRVNWNPKNPPTFYALYRAIVQGSFAHIGEIQAIKAMRARERERELTESIKK